MPPRRYRGILFGAGNVARTAHLPGFLATPELRDRLEIVAAVDARPNLPSLDGLPILTRGDEALQLGGIDFVDICTPTSSHLELALWALDQGLHVLCEKPVALSRREADLLGSRARAARRVVMPCHQYRWNPAWRKVREWLEGGRIGRWHLAEFRTYRPHADPGAGSGPVAWRGLGAASRGGVLLDHGTHLLYLLRDVAGPPSAVHAWSGRLRHRAYDVEDTAQLLLEYPDRLATLFLTWAGRGRETTIRFLGERGVIEWVGGDLKLDSDDGAEALDYREQLLKTSYPGWFAGLFRDFVEAMDRGSLEAPLADVAAVASVLEQAYEAGARSRGEEMPRSA